MLHDELLNTLACPGCGAALAVDATETTDLGVKEGTCRCEGCGAEYPVEDYVFYLCTTGNREGAAGREWKLENFERTYERLGAEQSAYEWRAKLGVPRSITNYDYPSVKGRLLKWLRPDQGELLLDVGCGSGYFLRDIARGNEGTQYGSVGLDVVPLRVRFLAEMKVREAWRDLVCVVGDGEVLPFRDGSFHYICCTEVLEHIPRPDEAIVEMSRVLRPGGKLCASTPCRVAIQLWAIPRAIYRLVLRKRHDETVASYDEAMHPWTFRRYLRRAGLTVDVFRTTVFIPPQDVFIGRPDWLARAFASVGRSLEKYLYWLLPYCGQHSVTRCAKPHDGQETD